MKITIGLGTNSITNAIKEITQYRQGLERKALELSKRLAEIGLPVAKVIFQSAQYDGINDVGMLVEPTDSGYRLVANGESVAFIEFGTGVYNPEHPLGEALGMRHGTYGKGFGNRRAWGFYNEDGSLTITHGNAPAQAMYLADKEILTNVARIAKEVFNSD